MRPPFPLAPALKFYFGEDDFGAAGLTAGERLFLWRRRMGLTQAEASDRIGLTRTAYAEVERSAAAAPSSSSRGVVRPASALVSGA